LVSALNVADLQKPQNRKLIMNIKYAFIGITIFLSTDAHANDSTSKLQDMIDDLGGDMALMSYNNGRTLKCVQGGTKRITVRFGEKTSTYSAYYDNCKEKNVVRDSIYEIETSGDKVVRDDVKPNNNKQLYDAALTNNINQVKTQLNNKADVNISYSMSLQGGGNLDRFTPLMGAATNGNLEIAKLLIKEGAWINFMNSDVRNALWYATNTGKLDLVKFLVDKGAYINISDLSGTTPLMLAAINGDSEIIKLFIKRKVNLDMKHNDGDSALMFAIANGHSRVAKLLIDAGADLNITNKYGVTALIICAVENNIEIAKYLIKNKAKTDAKTDFGKSALEIASAKGYAELVNILSEQK
jgi:ankyrin repeat protein